MLPMEPLNKRRARLAELIDLTSSGCEQAFAELYGMTHSYLYHVALRVVGSRPHAEEVLQEAYLSIWQQARRFEPEYGSAMTWLITVVRNQAVSALRSQRIERHSVSHDDEENGVDRAMQDTDDDPDPMRQAFYAHARSRLPAALARLAPAQRQAIALTFEHGMPHAELSVHMDVPLGTVKSWLRRGVARLGDYLSESDPPPPGRSKSAHPPVNPAMRC
jgi:RNA polymerase sigma-70 factor (ECF subfamily)